MSNHKTATVIDICGPGTLNDSVTKVMAEDNDGTPMTLFYPTNSPPEVGREIEVFFEMGGWCTSDSPVYKQRNGYGDSND